MQVEQQRHGAVTVVRPMGPLSNKSDSIVLLREIDEVMQKSLGRFILDATDVTFIDSSGLEALVDISDSMSLSGKSLRVCGVCETVREVFLITDVASKFQQYEDVQTAVRSFL
jgi:anti-anti-sigma factor